MPRPKTYPRPVFNSAGQPYLFSDQVGHLIRKAHQLNASIFQRMSPEPQLTSVQVSILFAIASYGASPQNTLGKLAGIDASTLTGVVDRLRERGLVKVTPHKGDRRKVIIDLTPAGEAVLARMAEVVHQITEATLAPLDAVERVALTHLLKKLTAERT
jgi:DNA-binding MarR family transcriptional regulator